VSLDSTTQQQIESLISGNEVVLFMKGNRGAPQCGFSSTVVRILDTLVPEYATVDVLSDPAVRDGIKEFSSWPTIPQLYLSGEFVGGCDIIQELFASGELQTQLGIELGEVATPTVSIAEDAVEGLREAMAQADPQQGGELHLMIDASHRSTLSMGPKGEGDIVVESNGIALLMDPVSASRADGVAIEMVDSPSGRSFRVNNPNTAQVRELSVQELEQLISEHGDKLELYDVRTPEERATCSIAGSTLMTDIEAERIQSLARDTLLVFYCHVGGRSQAAAEHFAALGFTQSCTVVGGIDAWSQEIDSGVPRY
jgi:monothiol glutaredoxin